MKLSIDLTVAQINLLRDMLYDESQDPRHGSSAMARRVHEEIDNAVLARKPGQKHPK
jgi:hypothetical protein